MCYIAIGGVIFWELKEIVCPPLPGLFAHHHFLTKYLETEGWLPSKLPADKI